MDKFQLIGLQSVAKIWQGLNKIYIAAVAILVRTQKLGEPSQNQCRNTQKSIIFLSFPLIYDKVISQRSLDSTLIGCNLCFGIKYIL